MGRKPEARGASRLVAEVGEAERTERLRLADALHDGPLQRLLAVRQDAEEAADGDPDALQRVPAELAEIARQMRALTSSMHEDLLDALPLEEGIRRIAQEAGARGRFDVVLEVDERAAGLHDAIVRDATRELLANVARHARARSAQVSIGREDDAAVVVQVIDDGVGFDIDRASRAETSGHVGLARLARTADELGGRIQLGRSDSGGTRAVLVLPTAALEAQASLEEQLREERRWSAALVGALKDGLVVVRDSEVVQVNDAFCAMTGFTREELLGASMPDYPFWPPEERTALMATVRTARDQRSHEEVVAFMRVDGSRFPALASSARIDDGTSGEIGLLIMIKDLTERQREEQRRRLESELRTTIGTTRRLTSILAAAGRGRDTLFAALGGVLIEQLTWGDAVVNLRRDDGAWEVAWTSSEELERRLGDATYSDADFAPYLEPRFARRGTYFVPEEANVRGGGPEVVLEPRSEPPPEGWRTGDLLLVPMRTVTGRLCGLISVDRPISGRRPSDTELDVLSAVAEHTALALALETHRDS